MSVHGALRAVRKRIAFVLLFLALGVGAAVAETELTTPVYEAGTQVFVSSQGGRDISGAYQGGLFTQQRVKSYAEIVNSPAVTDAVVRRLRLPETPAELAGKITAHTPLDTVLIDITARDGSATRARDIADAVAAEFSTLVPRLESAEAGQQAPVKVTVVQQAQVPAGPASPRPTVNLALGLLVGLVVGVAAALIRDALDTTIKGVTDVQAATGSAPLGVIVFDKSARNRPLVVHEDPRSPRSEAFRQLRTNLRFIDIDQPPKTVVVTSAVASEGKSTTSVNLAITMALAGAKVVLVEGDLRRPRVADYLGLEGAVGLTTVLTNGCALDDALQEWGRDRMLVLPSGALPPNPSELLGSRHMKQVLQSLEERADFVIIDAPPLLPVTDGAILARAASGAVLVVRHGKTRREQVQRAMESLQAVDSRLLGTVINAVPRKGADARGYGYTSHYYNADRDRPRLPEQAGAPVDASSRTVI